MRRFGSRLLLFLLFVFIALLTIGGKKQAPLSPHEELLAGQIGFDKEVFSLVREVTQDNIHRMIGYDENGYQIMADGFFITVPENETERVLAALRNKLRQKKYMAFVIEMNEGIKSDKIGILKGTDQYDILRVMQTNGDNYDITNEDIIERLKEWEKSYPFEIIGAENEWVEIEFRALPKDLMAFAEDVYDFCPDTVDEEAGSIAELSKEIKTTKRLLLWWE